MSILLILLVDHSLHDESSATVHSTTSGEPPSGNIRSFRWTLRRAATLMVQPETPVAKAPDMWASLKAIIFASCTMVFFRPCTVLNLCFRAQCVVGLYPDICMLLSVLD